MRDCFPSFFPRRRRRKSIPRCLLRGLGAELKTPRSQDSAHRPSFQIYLKGAGIRESRLVTTGVVRQQPSIVIHVVPRLPSNQESYRYRYKSLTVGGRRKDDFGFDRPLHPVYPVYWIHAEEDCHGAESMEASTLYHLD